MGQGDAAAKYLHVSGRIVGNFNLLAEIKINLQCRYCCNILALGLICDADFPSFGRCITPSGVDAKHS